MGVIQRDFETRVSEKSEALARERYHVAFGDLPPHMEMQVWIDAEGIVSDQMAEELREAQERNRGNRYFDDLEVERRLGK